jgi:hypothetical protein
MRRDPWHLCCALIIGINRKLNLIFLECQGSRWEYSENFWGADIIQSQTLRSGLGPWRSLLFGSGVTVSHPLFFLSLSPTSFSYLLLPLSSSPSPFPSLTPSPASRHINISPHLRLNLHHLRQFLFETKKALNRCAPPFVWNIHIKSTKRKRALHK